MEGTVRVVRGGYDGWWVVVDTKTGGTTKGGG